MQIDDLGQSCCTTSCEHLQKKFFWIPCPVCKLLAQLWRNFNNFSSFFVVFWLFRCLKVTFANRWSWSKLLHYILRAFAKKFFWIPCPVCKLLAQLWRNFRNFVSFFRVFYFSCVWEWLWQRHDHDQICEVKYWEHFEKKLSWYLVSFWNYCPTYDVILRKCHFLALFGSFRPFNLVFSD